MDAPQPSTAASSREHGGASGTSKSRTGGLRRLVLIAGVLLATLGLGLVAVGVTLVVTDVPQRDGRYVYTETERLQIVGHAIMTVPDSRGRDDEDIDRAGKFELESLISIHLRATPVIPDQRVFIGIADAQDMQEYLKDVPHSVYGDSLVERAGTRSPGPPTDQRFWEHSVIGTAPQISTLDVRSGDWVAVIMNADGTRPLWVDVQTGARTELFGLANPAALIAGIAALALGVPLVLLGARHRALQPRADESPSDRLLGQD